MLDSNPTRHCILDLTGVLLSILFTGVNASYAATNTREVCENKYTYISSSIKSQITVDDMLRSILKKQSDVIFLGVEHSNFETEIYPNLAKKIKSINEDIDCYFFEDDINASDQNLLTKFNSNDSSIDEKFKYRFSEERFNLWEKFRKLGLKIFAVDYPQKNSMPLKSETDFESWLNVRDSYMSEYISALKLSGQCKSAFFPIGLSHIVAAKNRQNLKSLLKIKGLTTSEILLIIAGKNSNFQTYTDTASIGPSWLWQNRFTSVDHLEKSNLICKIDMETPKKNIAFLNSGSTVPIAYLPDVQQFIGTYGEFQGTLIHVCSNNLNCMSENKKIDAFVTKE